MAHQKLKKGQARQKLVRDHFQEVSVELSLKAIFEQVLIKINLNKSVQTPIKGEAKIKECKSFQILEMKMNYFPSLKQHTLKTKGTFSVDQ